MILPCLTLSNIRYISSVKWSNPRKRVAPFPTPQCSSYWKGSLLVTLNHCRQLYLLLLYSNAGILLKKSQGKLMFVLSSQKTLLLIQLININMYFSLSPISSLSLSLSIYIYIYIYIYIVNEKQTCQCWLKFFL